MTLPSDDDDGLPPGELNARTTALQTMVAEVVSRDCGNCGAALCGHGALLVVVLGYRNAPRCPACLAGALHEDLTDLATRAREWILRRDCFLHVWRTSSAKEGQGDTDRPPCLFGAARTVATAAATAAARTLRDAPPATASAAPAVATYDAGDLGCGDLVLELRGQLRALPADAVLHVIARDPAAPVDLPAWCGLVGHTLQSSDHPHYFIRRKRD